MQYYAPYHSTTIFDNQTCITNHVMIPQYRPIYTPVHVHLVCGSILFPSSGGNSLVAKLSSGEPGVPGSSLMVSTSPLTVLPEIHDKNHDNSPDLQRSALVVPKPRIAISTLYRLQRRPCVHAPPLFVTEPPSSQQHSSPGADETRLCDFQKSEIEGDKKSSFGGIYFALTRMLSHVGIFF